MNQTPSSGKPRPAATRRRVAFLKKRLAGAYTDVSIARIRDLFGSYLDRLGPGPHDLATEADALEAAELTVLAEQAREDLKAVKIAGLEGNGLKDALKDKANLVNAITRLSSTAARSKRAFFKTAPAKPKLSLLQQQLIKDGKLKL